jgi:hypothetical protein
MSIAPFLGGRVFDAEQINVMSAAFANVCKTLRLSDSDYHLKAQAAQYVIEFGQRGFRNETVIYFLTLQEFRSHQSQKGPPRSLHFDFAVLFRSVIALTCAAMVAIALDTVMSSLQLPIDEIRTYALDAAASILVMVGAALFMNR